jgi:hypothetical protein
MFQGHLRGIDAWVSVTVQGAQRLLTSTCDRVPRQEVLQVALRRKPG